MVCIFYLGLYVPGCCCGRGQGGRRGSGLGKRSGYCGGGEGNLPCAGASAGSNGVCMPGTPGDWYWVEPVGSVCVRDGEIHFAILEDKCAVD